VNLTFRTACIVAKIIARRRNKLWRDIVYLDVDA
jgi:hypothetical protein